MVYFFHDTYVNKLDRFIIYLPTFVQTYTYKHFLGDV